MSSEPSGRKVFLARVAASLVLIVYVAGISVNVWLERRLGLQGENPMEDAFIVVGFGMFAVMGALLVALRPGNVVGWIMSTVGLIVGVFPAGESYAAYVMTTRGRPDALAVVGAWANGWYWFLLLALVFVYLPLLFPDGRLLSRRWIPVAVLPGIGLAGIIVLGAFTETLTGQNVGYRIENPIGIEGLAPIEELPVFSALSTLFYAVGVVGAITSVVVRFRRSRGIERQQIKWFLYAAAPILVVPLSDSLPTVVDASLFGWLLIGLPTAIGIAVLRYRLYDIDLFINRALVYGVLTVSLALVYLGGVAATQTVFRFLTGQEQQPQLAIVISTLTIAALFNPLRRRIQDFIDRRFYRKKYDAAKTLEAFSARVRDGMDLTSLRENLVGVAEETMQPVHASLWLRSPEPGKRR